MTESIYEITARKLFPNGGSLEKPTSFRCGGWRSLTDDEHADLIEIVQSEAQLLSDREYHLLLNWIRIENEWYKERSNGFTRNELPDYLSESLPFGVRKEDVQRICDQLDIKEHRYESGRH